MSGDGVLHLLLYGWDDWADDGSLIQELIDRGADVNAQGDLGYTPLHVACSKGAVPAAEVLLRNGADLTVESETSGTPVDVAKRREEFQGDSKIVAALKQ